ncbi:MAG: Hsp20/alpha crystallin family protein [Patescibacteria group bacterium]|nr:Hsp20/alpha crystallin family protein [Patescibacteria group bacterium]
MALIPWDPFRETDRFFDDDWLFPIVPRSRLAEPAMDVYETDKEVIAELNLPGVDPDKVNVSVKDQVLRVSGSMEEKKEEKGKGYWKQEIRRGSFERAVRLPIAVEEKKVEATYEKGVLKVTMPKAAAPRTETKVKVKAKGK